MKGNERGTARLPFLEHLEIFRRRLLLSLLFFLCFFVAAFFFIQEIIDFLKIPIEKYGIVLHYFKPQEKFLTFVKVAAFSALFAVLPFVSFIIGSFVYPGLYRREKKYFIFSLLFMLLFFFAGSYFSYSFIAPTAFRFFINFSGADTVQPVWGIGAYFQVLFTLVLMIGLSFQLPLVLLFCLSIGIVEIETLRKGRKIAFLLAFIAGAVLTPPDWVTQVIVGSVLYGLYEGTLMIGGIIDRKRRVIDGFA